MSDNEGWKASEEDLIIGDLISERMKLVNYDDDTGEQFITIDLDVVVEELMTTLAIPTEGVGDLEQKVEDDFFGSYYAIGLLDYDYDGYDGDPEQIVSLERIRRELTRGSLWPPPRRAQSRS